MAAYISVPRDLSRVKTKVFMNLTKRQVLCFGTAALVGVPLFFVLKGTGNVSFASMGMIVVMMPLFFLAMYEKDGQPLEVLAKHFIEAKFIRSKIRLYQTNNYYAALVRQYQVEKEVERIVYKTKKSVSKPIWEKDLGNYERNAGKADQTTEEADPGNYEKVVQE